MGAIIKLTETTAKTKQVLKEICAVCNTEGIVTPVEKISFDGLMMQALHEDGTRHRWSSYKSLFDLGSYRGEHKEEAKTIECPRCGRPGTIQSIRDRKKDIMRYRISHENLPQDKEDKRKQDLCFISKKDHRIIVLKALGRYIRPEYAICPKCGKEGKIGTYRPDKQKHPNKYATFYVHEPLEAYWGSSENKKKTRARRRCYMTEKLGLEATSGENNKK